MGWKGSTEWDWYLVITSGAGVCGKKRIEVYVDVMGGWKGVR